MLVSVTEGDLLLRSPQGMSSCAASVEELYRLRRSQCRIVCNNIHIKLGKDRAGKPRCTYTVYLITYDPASTS